jgi:predicted nucleic acid-binding protein
MLVVDASSLYEVVARGRRGDEVRRRLERADALAAPELIDAEVLGIIRRDHLAGRLDGTAARVAVDELEEWPGERFRHRAFISRAWELRDTVRTWDAFYVALAEALDAPLLTLDGRLARAPGIRCTIEHLP